MDPNEILTLAPHLQGIVTTIVAGVPFTEIVKRIVLPSADLLGMRMKDRVERSLGKAAKMIEDAEVTPQPVEDKLVVEILRGASLEDNEGLHTMWASLLANAANPSGHEVLPSFPQLLRQLSAHEAVFLDAIYKAHCSYLAASKNDRFFLVAKTALLEIYYKDVLSPGPVDVFAVAVDDLQRMGLLGTRLTAITTPHADRLYPNFEPLPTQPDYGYHFTDYGVRFMEAVRPPVPQS